MLFIIYSVFYNIHLNKNKELPIFFEAIRKLGTWYMPTVPDTWVAKGGLLGLGVSRAA